MVELGLVLLLCLVIWWCIKHENATGDPILIQELVTYEPPTKEEP